MLDGVFCIAAQKEAAVGIGQGERVAPEGIFGEKLSLEVSAPDVVGLWSAEWDTVVVTWLDASSTLLYQTRALEHVSYRAGRRKLLALLERRILLGQDYQELAGTPRAMAAPQSKKFAFDVRRSFMRAAMRRPAQLCQTRRSVRLVSVNPFVGGLA